MISDCHHVHTDMNVQSVREQLEKKSEGETGVKAGALKGEKPGSAAKITCVHGQGTQPGIKIFMLVGGKIK